MYTDTPTRTINADIIREAVSATNIGYCEMGLAVTMPAASTSTFMVELTNALLNATDDHTDAVDIARKLARTVRTTSNGEETILYFPDWHLSGDLDSPRS